MRSNALRSFRARLMVNCLLCRSARTPMTKGPVVSRFHLGVPISPVQARIPGCPDSHYTSRIHLYILYGTYVIQGDCTLSGIENNKCGPYPSTEKRATCYQEQLCHEECFRCGKEGRVYAGCLTNWDSTSRWGHGAGFPGTYHDAEQTKCSDRDFCNLSGSARLTVTTLSVSTSVLALTCALLIDRN